MTIREFARLCGCNPQTLRYYDHVDLLKPMKVDPWSGYRFYDGEQALTFVKIKNLQKAGFTIGEIKALLDQDHLAICRAFDKKIAAEEKRLLEIKKIRASYQEEMDQIRNRILQAQEEIAQAMRQYDPREEFGISREEYESIVENVMRFFENVAASGPKVFEYTKFEEGNHAEEEEEYLGFLDNPDYAVVYEKHGWRNVKEFLAECSDLEDGQEYAVYFRVDPAKEQYSTPFGNVILGILLARNPDKKKFLSCNIEESRDGENHFWMLKKKT